MNLRFFRWLLLAALALAAVRAESPRKVLLVSIDGLKPEYLRDADAHGLRLPYLRALWRDGSRASGVRGILPTLTYPSHTTLITGVAPARHGIYFNKPFDLAGKPDDLYWYAEDVRVPTLWQAVHAAGRVTGSVSWPVSVGARGLDFNIPEHFATRSDEDIKLVRALAGLDLMDELQKVAGPYVTDVNLGAERDWARTRYAVELIRTRKPDFLTFHVVAADHYQHQSGPFSPPALKALEEIDEMVRQVGEAMRANDPSTIIAIVSDHGFARVEQLVKLDSAFVDAGLVKLAAPRQSIQAAGVAEWSAMVWPAGGSAAIILKDPADTAVRDKVRALLDTLAADPANGIAGILDRPAIAALGGSPLAEFWVDLRPGFAVTAALGGPLASVVAARGVHGFVPTHPEMYSFFLVEGEGIGRGVDLGIVDMRAIAPTIARLLQVPFPSAELPAIDVLAPARN